MRSKLFVAFFLVITLALLSNYLFGRRIMKDFGAYEMGTREDHIYWLLASLESSYGNNPKGRGWDMKSLDDSLHWAAMLRFECLVEDLKGKTVMSSDAAVSRLSEAMRMKMQIVETEQKGGPPYEYYPLFHRGIQIGTLAIRDVVDPGSPGGKKERVFRHRGRQFLIMSFVLAGGGALFLALVFSQFLSRPVRELRRASEVLAGGDLSVRLPNAGADELGRLKAAFNSMAEALQREDSLRKRLTSNIAHELRTPLAIMNARIEAMMDGIIEADHAGLESLQVELDSLTRLIGSMEDLTKAEAGFLKKSPPEKVPLREFLEGIVEGIRPLLMDKGLKLDFAAGREFSVLTEPEKLEKVLKNIIKNAGNHTETGGVLVRYGIEEEMFFIEVEDTGKGIAPSEITRIFERFYKGKDSKGFGLGLAIARELVEIMGGSISAQSELGKGSVFRIVLPRGKER